MTVQFCEIHGAPSKCESIIYKLQTSLGVIVNTPIWLTCTSCRQTVLSPSLEHSHNNICYSANLFLYASLTMLGVSKLTYSAISLFLYVLLTILGANIVSVKFALALAISLFLFVSLTMLGANSFSAISLFLYVF